MFDFMTPQFFASMTVLMVIIHLCLAAAAYLILLERKVAAWTQDRIGPNRVGPLGLLQPIADGLKLLLKEDFLPRGADRGLFILAPALAAIPALVGFAVIPWAGTLDLASIGFNGFVKMIVADVNVGIIYIVAAASLAVYGVVIGGWASNSKYSFFGGMRAAAQMVSYEIPLGLSLLAVIILAGAVEGDSIISGQLAGGEWYLLHHPIAALLFYVCQLAEANRAPFDLAEAEAELVGGWHTEYSSMKWALFFLGEYVNMVVGGAFFVMLFLGGWSINPFGWGWDLPETGGIGLILLQFAIVLGKVFLIIFVTMMIRWTLPRFRFDQLMRLAWEGMIPLALLVILITSVWAFMGWLDYMWVGSILALVIALAAQPLIPRGLDPNRRIPLIGSRFSPLTETPAAAKSPNV